MILRQLVDFEFPTPTKMQSLRNNTISPIGNMGALEAAIKKNRWMMTKPSFFATILIALLFQRSRSNQNWLVKWWNFTSDKLLLKMQKTQI
ncbi:hypothetical protein BLOT_005845 [Blomia tropicalis]|nr:hypothetical protein BLOT_005845 [Blomia tropicalis]